MTSPLAIPQKQVAEARMISGAYEHSTTPMSAAANRAGGISLRQVREPTPKLRLIAVNDYLIASVFPILSGSAEGAPFEVKPYRKRMERVSELLT